VPFAGLRARTKDWLNHRLDEAVLRWLLRGMIAITAAVLVLDYGQRQAQVQEQEQRASLPPVTVPEVEPDISRTTITQLLPSFRREHKPLLRRGDDRLKSAMSFDLLGDGRLIAIGTIRPGTAKVFAAEIEKRGGYVKSVVLHSPGGSVSDAIEMGRLIRQKQFATEVESGRYCASSCPLVFAGGVERRAGESAAIGVHQVTALAASDTALTAVDGMDGVQRMSAECQKYLLEMGIDPMVWVHAMETPTDQLFYFTRDELLKLRLATGKAEEGKSSDGDPTGSSKASVPGARTKT
jgi:hypothetical protein